MRLKALWTREAVERGTDRIAGGKLRQLTSAALVSHNIYCEERYASTDGRFLAFYRSPNGLSPYELWVCDLEISAAAFVSAGVDGLPTSTIFSDRLYFPVRRGESGRALMRLDFKTFELDQVVDLSGCPRPRSSVCAVSPDDKYYVGNCRLSRDTWGLYRVDLESGRWEIFHEHREICNPHHQFEPKRGQDILVQLNRGCEIDDNDNIVRLVGDEGATLYVIDRDGKNERPLPAGKPHTRGITGHECWVGASGQIIFTTAGKERFAWKEIRLVAPGEQQSRLLWSWIGKFMHVSVSTCGRYVVTDDIANGMLYIGSLATGRMMPLCDTGVSCSAPQYTHAHAYMTSDNRRVIFNSDRTGLAQVWQAEVPEGFLQTLDLPRECPTPTAG